MPSATPAREKRPRSAVSSIAHKPGRIHFDDLQLEHGYAPQKADRGALPQLFAATAPTVRGGQFYGPSGFHETRGAPIEVQAVAAAHDPATGRRPDRVDDHVIPQG